MTLKYCGQCPPSRAGVGWNRDTVELGLHEQRTGITCLGAQMACCGNWLWEEKYPAVAEALWALAESHCQQDPAFRGTLSYTRLTERKPCSSSARKAPRGRLTVTSTMAEVSTGTATAAPGGQSQAQKNSRKRTPSCQPSGKGWNPITEATGVEEGQIIRLSIDCKATVNIGTTHGAEKPAAIPSGRPR